jgi:hypothetical protein
MFFSYNNTYFFHFDYILCSESTLEFVEKYQIWIDSAKYIPNIKKIQQCIIWSFLTVFYRKAYKTTQALQY